ncbi:MAG: HAD-IA family hydrolase [Pseudomonadota bacterium]
MTLKLAIWDMDGTIVDSREVIQNAMVRSFEALDLAPPPYEETRKTIGLGLAEACQILAPDVSGAKLDALVESYRQSFVQLRAEGDGFEPLYDGAAETLKRLAEDGWLLGIATGKARRGIEAFFEQHDLRDLFDTTWCADDGPGKPHPFMCEQAMAALGAEPDQSLIIGDAVHDIRMGLNAGIHTMGVSWGFGEAEELQGVGAHEVHHDFAALNTSLDQFAERLT